MSNSESPTPYPSAIVLRTTSRYHGWTVDGLTWRMATETLPKGVTGVALVSYTGEVTTIDPTVILRAGTVEKVKTWLSTELPANSLAEVQATIDQLIADPANHDLEGRAFNQVLRMDYDLVPELVGSWDATQDSDMGRARQCYELLGTDIAAATALVALLPRWANMALLRTDRQNRMVDAFNAARKSA